MRHCWWSWRCVHGTLPPVEAVDDMQVNYQHAFHHGNADYPLFPLDWQESKIISFHLPILLYIANVFYTPLSIVTPMDTFSTALLRHWQLTRWSLSWRGATFHNAFNQALNDNNDNSRFILTVMQYLKSQHILCDLKNVLVILTT